MVRLALPVAAGCDVPYRQLVNTAQIQLAELKRARDELLGQLQRHRKRARRARTASRRAGSEIDEPSRWLSYEQVQEINRARDFQPLTTETSSRIEAEVMREFSDERIDRVACVVTDSWVYRSEACQLSIEELPLPAMRKALAPKAWSTAAIQACYDCSGFDDRLAGMLLSPRGLEQTDVGPRVWISRDALGALQTTNARLLAYDTRASDQAPPRFAIADCFVAGTFDEVDAATVIERQAVGLVQTRGLIKVVYGGAGSMLQSHLLSWDNRHATIASRVPCLPTRDNFNVVLAGPMSSQQELAMAKQHECDGGRVRRLYDLMQRVNPLYSEVDEDRGFRGVDDPARMYCTRLNDSGDAAGLVAQARARQQSAAAPACADDTDDDIAARETTVLPSETVLMETAVDDQSEALLARAVDVVTRNPTFVTRHSTTILQPSDAFYMERLYPLLLTFGVGGFSSARQHRYSKRDIVLHYLNLSSNRFAEDPLFKMQMFDFLSTQRVRDGVFLRVRHDPSVTAQALEVLPEELRGAMEDKAAMRRAARAERPVEHAGRSRRASSLLKSITASTSKMWGSNEERETFQRKVNAMKFMYGEPSVFWTLTPNPDASIAVAFWAGYDLPNGRPTDLVACTEVNMPSSAGMKKLVMQNTVVQAQYYKLCCRVLIDTLFGWDSAVDKPKAEPGMFGFIEALFYALEQQGRLRVHHHGVLWVAGLPRTKADWDEVLVDASMRARFETYCSSLFAEQLPVFESLEMIECPAPECFGELASVQVHAKYKHILKHGTPPPIVAVCGACASEFTEAQVVAAVLERKWEALDAEHRESSTLTAVNALKMRFGGLSTHKPAANVQLSRLLLKDQVHAFEHTHSCVKGTTGTKCRYRFFRDLEASTRLTEDGEMKYQRRMGNQWLNRYIPLWRRVLHFNMDARLLWSGHSLQATRYAVQYASKRQSVLDNVAIVEMALKRRIEREALSTADKTKFSCKFERLGLLEGLRMMNDEEIEASVVSRGNQLFMDTSIRRYMERPSCLEDCSWYDFCAWFKPRSSTPSESTSACTFTSSEPRRQAEHVRAHGLSRVEYPRVPEIIGPRLPDARHVGDEEFAEQDELYCRAAALLYCPFRQPKQFLDESGSAKRHFVVWCPAKHPTLRRALDYHQQYYLSTDEAKAFRAEQAASEPEDTCDDQDIQTRHFDAPNEAVERFDSLVSVPPDAYSCMADALQATAAEAADLQDAADSHAMLRLLRNNVVGAALPDDSTASVVVRPMPVRKADLEAFEKQLGVEPPPASIAAAALVQTTEVTVELLSRAVSNLRFEEGPAQAAKEVGPFASVQDVSRTFGLNEEQHTAFVHIAVPLLHKVAGAAMPAQSCFNSSPLLVTGPGGTGKSRIVDAVRCLARSWNRPGCVMATASTGIAASNLRGHTMHSSVGLGINQTHLPKHLQKPSDEMLGQWDPVLCVVADELSMTDIGFFGLWEEALRKVKDCPEPFGGLIAVLMFDHCQLLTVRGSPVFKTADPKKPFSATQARGSLLYRTIDKAVYLKQNMRFMQDPEWGEWLAKARLGEWVLGMRAFLERVGPPPAEALRGQFVQVISTDNAFRQQINDSAAQIASQSFSVSRRVYAIPAKLPESVTPAEQAEMQNMADSQTGNIPVFFKVYVGMPARIKSNLCIGKGVANGASGKIFHIDWRPGTTFVRHGDGVWVATAQPANIYVDISNSQVVTRFPGLPAAWPSSVMPLTQTRASFKFKRRTISIKGFPVVPAFGTTVHGVQGDTRDQVVVTDLRPPHFPRVDRHALYVALSRLRTRSGLYWLGRKLDNADFDYFRPSQDVIDEDQRLRTLAAQTCSRTDLQAV